MSKWKIEKEVLVTEWTVAILTEDDFTVKVEDVNKHYGYPNNWRVSVNPNSGTVGLPPNL